MPKYNFLIFKKIDETIYLTCFKKSKIIRLKNTLETVKYNKNITYFLVSFVFNFYFSLRQWI